MKSILTKLIFLSIFITGHVFAQPGDPDLEHRLRWFSEAQDSVIKHPDNLYYRWARLDILFSPYFYVQTKPTDDLKEYLSSSNQFYQYVADSLVESYQPCDMCQFKNRKRYNPASKLGSFLLTNQYQLITDLTDLINLGKTFDSNRSSFPGVHVDNPNKAHFLYKRGQFYYFTGKKEKGLIDFSSALSYAPDEALKKQIYTSLAAYYYNTENTGSQEDYNLALKFLRLAEPALEDSSYYKGEVPRDYHFEREKIDLMKRYGDSTSLVMYLQNRAAGYLNYYYSLMATIPPDDHYYKECGKALERSREYEMMIYTFLYENDPKTKAVEYKKHKKLIVEKI